MNLEKILKYISPKKILDIGAHTGEFYNEMNRIYPFFEKYFAIEGNEYCEPYLKGKNIEYYIGLVGEKTGQVDFYRRKNNLICTGSSIYREISEHYIDEEIIVDKKDITNIDSIFNEDDFFDFVKIDTQGSEIDILKGGQRIFQKSTAILLEVSITQYNQGAPLYPEVLSFMSEFGFTNVETIGENRYPDGTVFQVDILFLKSN